MYGKSQHIIRCIYLGSFNEEKESNGLRGIVSSDQAGCKRKKRFGNIYVL